MVRIAAWLKRTALTMAGLCTLGIGAAVLLTGTAPGHSLLARLIFTLSDGQITVTGLSGNIFSHIAAQEIHLADRNGVWLKMQGVDADWRWQGLLHHRADVVRARAHRALVLRRPVGEPGGTPTHWQADIDAFSIARVEIAKDFIGHSAALTAAGALHYRAHDLTAQITLKRLDEPGEYRSDLSWRQGRLYGTAVVVENGTGLIGGLIGLPDLGPVRLSLHGGDEGRSNAIRLWLSAGAARAELVSHSGLGDDRINADFTLATPAMAPRPGLGWAAMTAHGHIGGSRIRPDISGRFTVFKLNAAEYSADSFSFCANGLSGKIHVNGVLKGLHTPGDGGAWAAPLTLTADGNLADAAPVFALQASHPLANLTGSVGTQQGQLHLTITDLTKLPPLTGLTLQGQAHLTARYSRSDGHSEATLDGTLSTRGNSLPARLIGQSRISATLAQDADRLHISGSMQGGTLSAQLTGDTDKDRHDYRLKLRLADISRLTPTLRGPLNAEASLTGPLQDLSLNARLYGVAGVQGFARDRVALGLTARGRPGHMQAQIHLQGRLADAPYTLTAQAIQNAGQNRIIVNRLHWRSLSGTASAVQDNGRIHDGRLELNVAQLADLTPLTGHPLSGRLQASASTRNGVTDLSATASNMAAAGGHLKEATVTARYVTAAQMLHLLLTATDFQQADNHGSATLSVDGALNNLQTHLTARLATGAGAVRLDARAALDARQRKLHLSNLDAEGAGQKLSLVQPGEVAWDNSLLWLDLQLRDKNQTHLAAHGNIPLSAVQNYDLTLSGNGDLRGWTSPLTAQGRVLLGHFDLSARVSGPAARPAIHGAMKLYKGRFHDVTSGLSLSALQIQAVADGPVIRIDKLSARAGSGNVTGMGSIGTDGTVALLFQADKAEPIRRDGLAMTLDGTVRLNGTLSGDKTISGDIRIEKGAFRLPDKLPPTLAILNVRRTQSRVTAPLHPSRTGLALRITSPGQFFVRGRGLEAELSGTLNIAGSTTAPQLRGQLTMRRGSYSLAGTTLAFQSGNLRFDGTNASGKNDPTLDFTAETTANAVTATLHLGGTLSAPQIGLTSSPALPQDEILAQLLFQENIQQLSPLQMATLAQGVASLSGLGGGVGSIDPIGLLRSNLRLDKLAVGSRGSGTDSTTTVEAGKYISRRIYLGARQDLSGGTRALVQVDLTRRLKLQGSVATGTKASATSTPAQDNGDTVGLSYQFDY